MLKIFFFDDGMECNLLISRSGVSCAGSIPILVEGNGTAIGACEIETCIG
jgi:hypothetical protein